MGGSSSQQSKTREEKKKGNKTQAGNRSCLTRELRHSKEEEEKMKGDAVKEGKKWQKQKINVSEHAGRHCILI